MTKELKNTIKKLPQTPGVYFFKDKNEQIIYIGKAINIKKRIQSHFSSQAKKERGWRNTIIDYSKIRTIDFIPTKTEKDALILESQLVKKHQPYYNLALKDDKNFLYIGFTKETYPRVFTTRQPNKYRRQTRKITQTDAEIIQRKSASNPRESADFIGPFIAGFETKEFLTNLRKLFPYRTCGARLTGRAKSAEALAKADKNLIEHPCLYYHLGLCNAHLEKADQYHLVVAGLKALIKIYLADWSYNRSKSESNPGSSELRVECYDISNTQGSLSVGSMVTFINNRANKSLYRKFKIKTIAGADDPKSLAEIIGRRLTHKEWKYPDLIIVDGGRAQLSKLKNFPIAIISISKTDTAKRMKTSGTLYSPYSYSTVKLSRLPQIVSETILRTRDEAHRFAITYHRLRRSRIYTD